MTWDGFWARFWDKKIYTKLHLRDPPESSNEVGFKVKVKGRQRFRVLSSRTQIDGTRDPIQCTLKSAQKSSQKMLQKAL